MSYRDALVVIGPHRSGKTHFFTLLAIHLEYLATRGEGIYFRPQERLDTASADLKINDMIETLTRGEELSHTPVGKQPFGGALRVVYPRVWGDKEIIIPLFDVAGELYKPIMEHLFRFREGEISYPEFEEKFNDFLQEHGLDRSDVRKIHDLLFSARAYAIVLNLVHCIEAVQSRELEKYPEVHDRIKDKLLGADEAGNLISKYVRTIDAMMEYRKIRKLGRPRDIAIVFTHYDLVRDWLEINLNYRVYENDEDRLRMANFFIHQLLVPIQYYMRRKIPEIFISYTELGRYKVDDETNIRLPIYPIKEYNRIIRWIERVYR